MAEVTTDRKLAAEFIGTAALVIGGPGTAAATFMLINGQTEGAPTAYTFDMTHLGIISFAFMLVILAIIYTFGHISGAHFNPAVTIALAAFKKFDWKDVPGYVVAQVAGATAGALAIWGSLGDGGLKAGLGVLSYAKGNADHAFFAELIGTFLLVIVIWGTAVDGRATPGWYGLAIPSIVFAVITATAPVTGAALNPARYIGPMLGAAILDTDNDLLWEQVPVYFIATVLGALIAGAVYTYVGGTKPSYEPSAADAERVSA
jgi:glycerol uptake facilitator protein